MNARHLVSSILQYSGVNAAGMALRRDSLAVLCYHRVLDATDPEYGSADPALVTTSHVFERQMEIISRCFHPVGLRETLQWSDGQGHLPPRAVLVTFDDGTADTYSTAFPIMKRFCIPGVVFLATGFIGTRERHWTDVVHERIAARSGRRAASAEVERLKRMPSSDRYEVIQDLVAKANRSTGCIPNLTWEQVEEMSARGFEFGSHTRNHVILPPEPDDTVRRELSASAEDIGLRLGHTPTVIAYPDGQFDARLMRLAGESGLRLAFTCDEGFASRRCDSFAFPRLLMHDGISTTRAGDFSPSMFLTYLAGTIPRRYRRTPG